MEGDQRIRKSVETLILECQDVIKECHQRLNKLLNIDQDLDQTGTD